MLQPRGIGVHAPCVCGFHPLTGRDHPFIMESFSPWFSFSNPLRRVFFVVHCRQPAFRAPIVRPAIDGWLLAYQVNKRLEHCCEIAFECLRPSDFDPLAGAYDQSYGFTHTSRLASADLSVQTQGVTDSPRLACKLRYATRGKRTHLRTDRWFRRLRERKIN